MTIISAVQKASQYAGDGVTKDLKKWILLIILFIIQGISLCFIPLLNGYIARVFHTPDNAPDVQNWMSLFIDGWKMNVIFIMYAIPVIIILVFFGALSIISFDSAMTLFQGKSTFLLTALLDTIGFFGMAIAGILFVFLTLVMFMAMVRTIRKGSISEAYNITAIVKDVSSKTGWFDYFILWIVLWVLTFIFAFICFGFLLIPLLGNLLILIIAPVWIVFFARYITIIYDGEA